MTHPGRVERVLAVGRAFLAVTGLIAIYLDPTEPTRLQAVTYGVLLSYAVYSLCLLAYLQRASHVRDRHARSIHGIDIVWTSVLTFASEGPVSPFFLFFLFVLLAAAYRGGFRATIGTALVFVAVFLGETVLAAGGAFGFELNAIILRVAYLLMTGALLGYLAEQDKRSRAELTAIAEVTRQPRVSLGLGGSIGAVGRALLATFEAREVAVVIADRETGRTLLWRIQRSGSNGNRPARARRVELAPDEEARWLGRDVGAAWQVERRGASGAQVWTLEPGASIARVSADTDPEKFAPPGRWRRATAVNMGLAGEWRGRIYLFDAAAAGDPSRALFFLVELKEHVEPALTNVFLLRRLRARAGAAERARVARELHDGAIQALFAIEMKLEAFRRSPNRSPAFVDREVGEVQQLLRQEVLALRELMQALRPVELEGRDQLPDAIASLVERFRRDTGISARFVSSGGAVGLSPRQAIEAVRIVQEALANVRKHAGARHVLVSLSADAGGCRLVIEDDGRGFEFEGRLSGRELEQRHVGPAIIKERARLAGAALAVESMPGAGARLELTFAEETMHA